MFMNCGTFPFVGLRPPWADRIYNAWAMDSGSIDFSKHVPVCSSWMLGGFNSQQVRHPTAKPNPPPPPPPTTTTNNNHTTNNNSNNNSHRHTTNSNSNFLQKTVARVEQA
jgi:hypothetical protein